ncbi:DNA polymerase ligase N-terminal domain-containing protein [Nocardioides sp. SOB77]|uniref:DNA polymerase ligase N-terminal domain-containing protein n=1 Tax=Nocardioides oceani TaxID=3058369 RepID=A0ABT8FLF7_9ACTN|nr:DNA polymerase ligase N-terminal domain-containing protein [Nocardioides oceani]MDN4175355.1 DNA polymerase ligase N-terminal domain-containing protein [Nocardioides oceani]
MSDQLAAYRAKRDFARTPEPSGDTAGEASARTAASGAPRFVVQRHRASHLHYDLRFEIGGVLVSWAVPKGPTLDPAARRLAVHVEDHPVDYLHFEGTIPGREYGGGDVIVWDTGTFEAVRTDDPVAAVADGELHVEVHGRKLRGRLVLLRRSEAGGKEEWMLLHKRDEHAVDGWDPEEHPRSVLSGRTNDDVVAGVPPTPPAAVPDGAIDALAALPGSGGTWEVHGRGVKVTNLDKVLFPGHPQDADRGPVTKRELLAYAAQVAPVALPYLEGRAVNLHRYPEGADEAGFWHKQRPGHAPAWVGCWGNPEADEGETTAYVVADEPATLVWMANFGALEWHPWTSRTEAMHEPTYALVDLDPGERTSWEELLVLARLHRTALEHLGVTALPKVTGRRGIQVWIPVVAGYTFSDTRAWVERLSRTVGKVVPELVSWKWEVRARGGLARLDYTQNAVNKTLVGPWSPRPAPGAPVSVPIRWEELDDPDLRPDRWTIRTALERIAEHGDPFRGLLGAAQELPEIS